MWKYQKVLLIVNCYKIYHKEQIRVCQLYHMLACNSVPYSNPSTDVLLSNNYYTTSSSKCGPKTNLWYYRVYKHQQSVHWFDKRDT